LTEVAQSRTTHKHGSKINAKLQKISQDMGYENIKRANRVWYSKSGSSVKLSEMQRLDTPYVLDDIEVVFDNLVRCGFDKVIAVDLTRPEVNIPSVRMIVPGLEVSTMDPEREGRRLNGTWDSRQQ
jgi:ribosomal protein S12 methylthiotransferase accessory factor